MKLTEKDLEILNQLEKNCKQSLKTLSKKLRIPMTTIYEKIKKMEREGIIRAYTAIVNYDKLGFHFPALIELTVETEDQQKVAKKLIKHPNVFNIYGVTGTTDMIIFVRFKNREDLSNFVLHLFSLEGIERTNTRIVLTSFDKF